MPAYVLLALLGLPLPLLTHRHRYLHCCAHSRSQETIGSAIALKLLTHGRLPLAAGCAIVSVTAFGLLLLDRVGFRQLEALFAVLIAVEAVAMGWNFSQAGVNPEEVLRGTFIPQVSAWGLLSSSMVMRVFGQVRTDKLRVGCLIVH